MLKIGYMLYRCTIHIFLYIYIYIHINTNPDIDDCESEPCLPNGNCTDGVNAFECTCLPGFNGSLCEIGIEFVLQLVF